jgi:Zn-dependent peptidase ImmA (M78 family)
LAASPFSEELPYERGARRALELRLEVGLSDEPIRDLWALVRGRGVSLAFHDFGANGGDGLYRWNGQTALIAANSSTSSRLRQRFTVAHELGHHELHREDGAPLLIADKDIFGRREPVEEEANSFAGHLLMPDPAIARTLGEWQVATADPPVVARLMQRYGLSYDAVCYRLRNARRITLGELDALRAAKERVGVRALCESVGFNEFIDFPLPAPLPPAFESDVLRAYAARAITDERLAELLRVPAVEQALAHARAAGVDVEHDSGELSDEEFEALLGG